MIIFLFFSPSFFIKTDLLGLSIVFSKIINSLGSEFLDLFRNTPTQN
jgi:hypothetical protein